MIVIEGSAFDVKLEGFNYENNIIGFISQCTHENMIYALSNFEFVYLNVDLICLLLLIIYGFFRLIMYIWFKILSFCCGEEEKRVRDPNRPRRRDKRQKVD